MSTTTSQTIELDPITSIPPTSSYDTNSEPPENAYSTTAIPDGGYGWTIVLSCGLLTFWFNGMVNCWGVLQTALLDSTLSHTPTSTLSFVGSLGLACGVAFGLFGVRLMRWLGSRTTAVLGVAIMGAGLISSGFTTSNVVGLFGTSGLLAGIGMSLIYVVSNSLPVQYFSGKLGLANGLVKAGGGVGATIMAIALEALVRRVGIEWTFRIQGLMTVSTGIPAAWLLKDRVPLRNTPFIDLSMFRSLPFTAVFLAGAIGTFALFVPPYFLPLFAQSIGLSSKTGAALVSAFSACNALGRFVAGFLCDSIGPVNMFAFTMVLNAVSMLAIWPVSESLAPLVVFSMLNGIANGAFFTILPTVVAKIFSPGRAVVAMGMATTGWTAGYLMGAPIAGYLLQAGGGTEGGRNQGIEVYRPAIFYAGGVAFASSLFVLVARVKLTKKMVKV
ncbi:MFS transporter, MCP family, solute carrier family 16, member 10 [Zopfia rhizophila CBS 207.26]|uniref:MFS transporter, MCP family, solute carrier family 16, member 10 n=1 Tax=Zopfia rhizophila CBS 207.26 TaxID=1314779 RepID=A0A6A6DID7_9PEZI|nr:MFS transporter, MCP family, solute carrier family 16, member 10 [Zopfia rhizophila CBS 207.26]